MIGTFVLGTYNLDEDILEAVKKHFEASGNAVKKVVNVSELSEENVLMTPDILLVDMSITQEEQLNILHSMVKGKKTLIVSLGNETILNNSGIYELPYHTKEVVSISNDVIRIMANTIRSLKIQDLSKHLISSKIKKVDCNAFNIEDYVVLSPNKGAFDESDFINMMKTILSFIETKDNYTKSHCERVAIYATVFAQRLGFSKLVRQRYYYAGLVHDVGKIGIPDHILSKTGFLEQDEYELMKKHTELAENLLPEKELAGLKAAIRSHHERYDGKGYPDGLVGENIPYESRVLAIVDAFDAMTTKRGYNQQKSTDEAIIEMEKCSGTQFDPVLVAEFILLIKRDMQIIKYFIENSETKPRFDFPFIESRKLER